MKVTSKIHKHPADDESCGIPPTSPKLQSKKQKPAKLNQTQKYQKENGPVSASRNDVPTKFGPKGDTSKDTQVATTKVRNRMKSNGVTTKSPSPPPLPPPTSFISPLSMKIETSVRDRKHTNFVEEGRVQSTNGKQYLKPSIMAVNKNPQWKKNASSKSKAPLKSSLINNSASPTGRKSKIRLPYDNDFCCDDDKFHLLGVQSANKDDVSIDSILDLVSNLM